MCVCGCECLFVFYADVCARLCMSVSSQPLRHDGNAGSLPCHDQPSAWKHGTFPPGVVLALSLVGVKIKRCSSVTRGRAAQFANTLLQLHVALVPEFSCSSTIRNLRTPDRVRVHIHRASLDSCMHTSAMSSASSTVRESLRSGFQLHDSPSAGPPVYVYQCCEHADEHGVTLALL